MSPATRQIGGLLGLLLGIALVLKSFLTNDALRDIHIIAGLTIIIAGGGLMLGFGRKDSA